MPVDPSTPARALSPSPAWERKILARWRELEPRVKLRMHVSSCSADDINWRYDIHQLLEAERLRHRAWLLTLLSRQIDMRHIRRTAMDDPTRPPEVLRAEMTRYILKRSRRKPYAHK